MKKSKYVICEKKKKTGKLKPILILSLETVCKQLQEIQAEEELEPGNLETAKQWDLVLGKEKKKK